MQHGVENGSMFRHLPFNFCLYCYGVIGREIELEIFEKQGLSTKTLKMKIILLVEARCGRHGLRNCYKGWLCTSLLERGGPYNEHFAALGKLGIMTKWTTCYWNSGSLEKKRLERLQV